MQRIITVFFLTLIAASTATAQLPADLLAKIRQIKLLESTRADVNRILKGFETDVDGDHYQRFSNDSIEISISYSTGECSEDSEDASEVWNVRKGAVTRVEISPDEPVDLRHAGFDLSKFKKEPRWPDDPDALVFYDKATGFALKTNEDGMEKLIFFPSQSQSRSLCRNASAAKGFYIRKGWFSAERPYDYGCILVNQFASVNDVKLSSTEIDLSVSTTVSVETSAVDPENDVLTYNYTVTAGRIVGVGAKVEWDLTGVQAGTYTIVVGVDDGAGIVGKTITRTVTVK